MSTPAPYTFNQRTQEEKNAFFRRQHHDTNEAMINLTIAQIEDECLAALPQDLSEKELKKELKHIKMPPAVRAFISAVQGSHGGGQVINEEFKRGHLSIGRQLGFTGTDDAICSRVRNRINALEDWQYRTGYRLFTVIPGGAPVFENGVQLFHPDKSPIREKTTYIDHLLPVTDHHVQLARQSALWKENPGRAMAAQAISAVKDLPRLGTRAESGAEKVAQPMPLNQYEDQQEAKICDFIEKRADQIELRGGDSDLWLEKLEVKIKRIRDSRRKTAPARRDYAALSIFDDELPPPPLGNKNLTQSNTGVFHGK